DRPADSPGPYRHFTVSVYLPTYGVLNASGHKVHTGGPAGLVPASARCCRTVVVAVERRCRGRVDRPERSFVGGGESRAEGYSSAAILAAACRDHASGDRAHGRG